MQTKQNFPSVSIPTLNAPPPSLNPRMPVTERALFSRINRKLKKEGEILRRCRENSRFYADMGPYYAVDVVSNTVTARGVSDLEAWGRDLGVMRPFEKLAA